MDKLLKLLEQSASIQPDKLGPMLGISAADVKKKIQKYEEDKIILGYKAVINDEVATPQAVKAAIEIGVRPERSGGFNRTAARIAKFDQVDSCFLMSGGYDLLLFVQGKDLREVATFVSEKLATLENVQSTATHFILKTYKTQGFLMQDEEESDRLSVAP